MAMAHVHVRMAGQALHVTCPAQAVPGNLLAAGMGIACRRRMAPALAMGIVSEGIGEAMLLARHVRSLIVAWTAHCHAPCMAASPAMAWGNVWMGSVIAIRRNGVAMLASCMAINAAFVREASSEKIAVAHVLAALPTSAAGMGLAAKASMAMAPAFALLAIRPMIARSHAQEASIILAMAMGNA